LFVVHTCSLPFCVFFFFFLKYYLRPEEIAFIVGVLGLHPTYKFREPVLLSLQRFRGIPLANGSGSI